MTEKNGPHISRKWHIRDDRLSRLPARYHALNWMRRRMFHHKDDLDYLLKLEGGNGSWWVFYEYGMARHKGWLRVALRGEEVVEEFSIKELYDTVKEEKDQRKLF